MSFFFWAAVTTLGAMIALWAVDTNTGEKVRQRYRIHLTYTHFRRIETVMAGSGFATLVLWVIWGVYAYRQLGGVE